MKIPRDTFDQAVGAAIHAIANPATHPAHHAYVSYIPGRPDIVLIDGDVDVQAAILAALTAAGVEVEP